MSARLRKNPLEFGLKEVAKGMDEGWWSEIITRSRINLNLFESSCKELEFIIIFVVEEKFFEKF